MREIEKEREGKNWVNFTANIDTKFLNKCVVIEFMITSRRIFTVSKLSLFHGFRNDSKYMNLYVLFITYVDPRV